MKRTLYVPLACSALLLAGQMAWAELRLPALFSHNAVLQQGTAVNIWGWADEGEVVSISYRGEQVTAVTSSGKWSAQLKYLTPGPAATLTVATKSNRLQRTNVIVGEVWVCSGQSNMEWPLNQSFRPEADIASATNSQIRLFLVAKKKAETPTNDVAGAWVVCSPKSVAGFSAVGYYFGRDLQEVRKVPVGLIGTYWGGSPAEAWMRRAVLEANPGYKSEILDQFEVAQKNYQAALATYEKEKAEAQAKSENFTKRAPWSPWRPSELYNGMIASVIPYTIKGAIWYQGESNAGRAEQYRSLFADMITNWRTDWHQGLFPFIAVQLAPFKDVKSQPGESDWAELREAQWLATKRLKNVGMAVITDVGDPKDIHPAKKKPVGQRLALQARSIAYGEPLVTSGPIYQKMIASNNRIEIVFEPPTIGTGLTARGGELKGFAICGEDRKFVWADAEIVGTSVVVSSPEVSNPVAVRYGWADCPVVNLWNKEGLPASPFRTDDFPMITAGKK